MLIYFNHIYSLIVAHLDLAKHILIIRTYEFENNTKRCSFSKIVTHTNLFEFNIQYKTIWLYFISNANTLNKTFT